MAFNFLGEVICHQSFISFFFFFFFVPWAISGYLTWLSIRKMPFFYKLPHL